MLMSRWPATEALRSLAIARTSVEVNRVFDMMTRPIPQIGRPEAEVGGRGGVDVESGTMLRRS